MGFTGSEQRISADVFRRETADQLKKLDQCLEQIRRTKCADIDTLTEAFEIIHAIGCSATSLGFAELSAGTQRLEKLLLIFREQPQLSCGNAKRIMTLLYDYADYMSEELVAASEPNYRTAPMDELLLEVENDIRYFTGAGWAPVEDDGMTAVQAATAQVTATQQHRQTTRFCSLPWSSVISLQELTDELIVSTSRLEQIVSTMEHSAMEPMAELDVFTEYLKHTLKEVEQVVNQAALAPQKARERQQAGKQKPAGNQPQAAPAEAMDCLCFLVGNRTCLILVNSIRRVYSLSRVRDRIYSVDGQEMFQECGIIPVLHGADLFDLPEGDCREGKCHESDDLEVECHEGECPERYLLVLKGEDEDVCLVTGRILGQQRIMALDAEKLTKLRKKAHN